MKLNSPELIKLTLIFGNRGTFTVLVLKLIGSYSHYVYNELLVTLTKTLLWND